MVRLYIEGKGYLDLFDDEKIELNESVQNISDLTKVFTAYTQSFTVPATDNNNKIFKHWYDSNIYNGYDAQKRSKGWIELNDIVYKFGNYQLEKVNTKDGRPNNYSISFVGELTDLKDILGDKTLKDLDYTAFSFNYTGANVKAHIEHPTNYYIGYYFPFVSSERVWVNTGGGANDITTTGGAIRWNELFPSVSMYWLLNNMITQFNLPIDYLGDVITSTNLYHIHVLFKNKELKNSAIEMPSDEVGIDFSTGSVANGFINLTTNKVRFPEVTLANWYTIVGNPSAISLQNVQYILKYNITVTGDYTLNVFKNGQYYKTIKNTGSNTGLIIDSDATPNVDYTFTISTALNQTVTFTTEAILGISTTDIDFNYLPNVNKTDNATATIVTSSKLNFNSLAPEIKLIDIIKTAITLFNATITRQGDKLVLDSLESWYLKSDYFDITPYVNQDSIDYTRAKLPKSISFKKEDSKSAPNVAYYNGTNLKYGDLTSQFEYDGGDIKFEIPFETPIPINLFNGESYMMLLDKDAKPYIPKGCLIAYNDRLTATSVRMNIGGTQPSVTAYFPVSTTIVGNNDHTINFGAEYDQVSGTLTENSIYKRHYKRYFDNLYNSQSRPLSCKARFPYSILNKLSLNDRFILNQNTYIINDYKLDLTTGDAQLNLLNDFRNPIEEIVINISASLTSVSFTPSLTAGMYFITSDLWYGNQPMGINYTGAISSSPIVFNVPANTSEFSRQGYYFIYYYIDGIIQDKVLRVRIIQDGASLTPSNALATTYGELFVTTYGEYIITTY
jgi:hypothetical protein